MNNTHRSSQNLTGTNHSDVDICISTLWNELISTKTLAYILKKSNNYYYILLGRH